jgi:hypothetical protein
MAFDVYIGAHRDRSRARRELARFAVDVSLAIVLGVLATQLLMRLSVVRVEPPRIPIERDLTPLEVPTVPAPRCGGWPMSGDEDFEDEDIPEDLTAHN